MVDIKKFLKLLKHYLSYLMKVGFKDLFISVIELVLLVVLAGLVYVPLDLIKDIIYKIYVAIFGGSTSFYSVLDIILSIITFIAFLCVFIWLFNKRYENIENEKGSRQDNLYLNKDNKDKKKEKEENNRNSREEKNIEELDLPKAKK